MIQAITIAKNIFWKEVKHVRKGGDGEGCELSNIAGIRERVCKVEVSGLF